MQPLQYDVRCPAAKANSITHAAAAPSNLDAAITVRSGKTELHNTKLKELRAGERKVKLSCETDFPPKLKVEDAKTKLSCETSLQN